MKICAATNNPGKLKELSRILEAQGHTVKSLQELNIHIDPVENGNTFTDNAFIKAQAICKVSALATVADDSGLCVNALNGAPGVYSARYAGEHGNDDANNSKLLAALRGLPREKRSAKFVSAICFMLPDGKYLTCEGECSGWICTEYRKGEYGFGYDPIFIPDNVGMPNGCMRKNTEQRSYAQLTACEKDVISHRGQAMKKLQEMLPFFLNT